MGDNRVGLAGRRGVVVAVRLTGRECEELVDSRRGALTRSAYIRWMLRRAQTPAVEPEPPDQV